LAITYLETLKHKAFLVSTFVAVVLFTGRERGGKSGIHSKKILIRSWPPTNIIPVTATLDRVNKALLLGSAVQASVAAARNEKKKKQKGFETVQNGKKVSIHEVHMYMIG
jgi:hypothetical protein